jgi:SAM-dependent methyltransferase
MATRFNAPYWRHDAYTLRKLAAAIVDCIGRTQASGVLLENTTVVDLGCGEAPYKTLLTAQGARYIGCDIEPGGAVDQVIDTDGTTALPDGLAQCVTSFQVLEHVWDLDRYLGECRRLLAEDGLLILSTHGNWLYHPHPTDFRRWTLDGLLRELTSRGFSIVETWPIVGPLAWTTQFRTLAYHHVLKKLGPVGKLLSAILCLMMYVRMTLEDKLTPKTLIRNNAAVYLVMARPQKT